MDELKQDFDWSAILFGEENWTFYPEVVLRTLIMYVIILFSLRLLGKRGVKQLSVFELVVIISLGSAAGDPMFYKEVGLLSGIVVFICIILAYKITTYFVGKHETFERLIEGTCTCLIEEGRFAIENFKKEPLAYDEFFSELRASSISHLGQVQQAIIETSGNISIYYYADEDVKYGLPILPQLYKQKSETITAPGLYACSFCGTTAELQPTKHNCARCNRKEWVKAINAVRVR